MEKYASNRIAALRDLAEKNSSYNRRGSELKKLFRSAGKRGTPGEASFIISWVERTGVCRPPSPSSSAY